MVSVESFLPCLPVSILSNRFQQPVNHSQKNLGIHSKPSHGKTKLFNYQTDLILDYVTLLSLHYALLSPHFIWFYFLLHYYINEYFMTFVYAFHEVSNLLICEANRVS